MRALKVDDKETKNIDGIKSSDTTQENVAEKIDVTVEDSTQEVVSTDVSISSDGDIAVEVPVETTPDVSDSPSPTAPTEDNQTESAEPEQTMNNEDPGIVPSVQPAAATSPSSPVTEVARLKERVKHLKIWLAVLVLLLVGVASALVVYFGQQSQAKSDLKSQQEQNAALQQELAAQEQTATQKTIDDLTAQLEAEKAKNVELQKTVDAQNEEIASYQAAVKKLLEACGASCSTVEVPEEDPAAPTGDNTTN